MVVLRIHWQREAGAQILKKGGNAFDMPRIVTQFALQLFIQCWNIGGGGFLVGYTKMAKNRIGL